MELNGKKALIFAIFAAFLWVLLPFIQAICLALLLSSVLALPVEALEQKFRLRRSLSSFLVSLVFSLGVLVPLIVLLIFVCRELIGVSRDIEEFLVSQEWLSFEIIENIQMKLSDANLDLEEKWGGIMSSLAKAAASFVGKIASSLPQLVLDLFIFVITLYYSLVHKERLRNLFSEVLPLNQTEFNDFSAATVGIFRGVIVGTLISGVVQGSFIGLGYWFLDVPKPLLFASLTAFLALIPLLGTGPTGIGACIYLVANDRPVAAVVMLVIFGLASFSDNIIKPWVLKDSMEMHPLLALLGALGGLAVFGFIGLFLGPLVVALAVISLKIHTLEKNENLKI